MDPTRVFNFFTFFERILYKSNCIIFIFSWCATHTKIRSKLVVIVTAGSQKITLWGPQRTPLGILRVKSRQFFGAVLYSLDETLFTWKIVFWLNNVIQICLSSETRLTGLKPSIFTSNRLAWLYLNTILNTGADTELHTHQNNSFLNVCNAVPAYLPTCLPAYSFIEYVMAQIPHNSQTNWRYFNARITRRSTHSQPRIASRICIITFWRS